MYSIPTAMPQHRFIVCNYSQSLTAGTVGWQSPSNIALVKYWGKYGEQMPLNPSISFTLKNSHTRTLLNYEKKQTENKNEKLINEKKVDIKNPKVEEDNK